MRNKTVIQKLKIIYHKPTFKVNHNRLTGGKTSMGHTWCTSCRL